jgi:hypothetical protein
LKSVGAMFVRTNLQKHVFGDGGDFGVEGLGLRL